MATPEKYLKNFKDLGPFKKELTGSLEKEIKEKVHQSDLLYDEIEKLKSENVLNEFETKLLNGVFLKSSPFIDRYNKDDYSKEVLDGINNIIKEVSEILENVKQGKAKNFKAFNAGAPEKNMTKEQSPIKSQKDKDIAKEISSKKEETGYWKEYNLKHIKEELELAKKHKDQKLMDYYQKMLEKAENKTNKIEEADVKEKIIKFPQKEEKGPGPSQKAADLSERQSKTYGGNVYTKESVPEDAAEENLRQKNIKKAEFRTNQEEKNPEDSKKEQIRERIKTAALAGDEEEIKRLQEELKSGTELFEEAQILETQKKHEETKEYFAEDLDKKRQAYIEKEAAFKNFKGSDFEKSELHTKLSQIKTEYEEAKEKYGRRLRLDKISELKQEGIDENSPLFKENLALLNKELFQNLVIGEQDKLAALNVANLEPRKRTWFRRMAENYAKMPLYKKIAISTMIVGGLIGAGSLIGAGVGFASGAAAASFGAKRFVRGIVGGKLAMLGAGFVKTFGARKIEEYRKNELEKLDNLFGVKAEKTGTAEEFRKLFKDSGEEYEKIIKEANKKHKNITRWSIVAAVGIGGLSAGAMAMTNIDGPLSDLINQKLGLASGISGPSIPHEAVISGKGLGGAPVNEIIGAKPTAETTGLISQIEELAKHQSINKEHLMELATIKKGEGVWHAVYRQLEDQVHRNPLKFGLKPEDLENAAKVKQVLNKETMNLLIKNHCIDPEKGVELRIVNPGTKVILEDDNGIKIFNENLTGTGKVYEASFGKPNIAVPAEQITGGPKIPAEQITGGHKISPEQADQAGGPKIVAESIPVKNWIENTAKIDLNKTTWLNENFLKTHSVKEVLDSDFVKNKDIALGTEMPPEYGSSKWWEFHEKENLQHQIEKIIKQIPISERPKYQDISIYRFLEQHTQKIPAGQIMEQTSGVHKVINTEQPAAGSKIPPVEHTEQIIGGPKIPAEQITGSPKITAEIVADLSQEKIKSFDAFIGDVNTLNATEKIYELAGKIKTGQSSVEDFAKYYVAKVSGANSVSSKFMDDLKNNFEAINKGIPQERLNAISAIESLLKRLMPKIAK